jgi:hypothetical protein
MSKNVPRLKKTRRQEDIYKTNKRVGLLDVLLQAHSEKRNKIAIISAYRHNLATLLNAR